ncbi:MAG: hypothetical protein N2Z85_02045 [Patescibacteria group bacterium]|nr:hypothetical protein [Patescibacteria group bacterium]
MTGQELKSFIEVGLDCGTQSNSLFYNNLNLCKNYIENLRDWKQLEKELKINNYTISDDKILIDFPSDFKLLIRITDKSGKNLPFKLDLINKKIVLDKNFSSSSYILVYKIKSPDITNNTSWIFPDEFHPILGYLYSAIYKAGIDFDSINASNSLRLDKDFSSFLNAMIRWDNDIKYYENNGIYEGNGYYDKFGLPI